MGRKSLHEGPSIFSQVLAAWPITTEEVADFRGVAVREYPRVREVLR